MTSTVDAVAVTQFHDGELAQPDWPVLHRAADLPGAWRAIDANHRYNCLLWQEEDRAHRVDVPAAKIASSKRLIDRYNQQRNDAVEAIDEALLAGLDGIEPGAEARLSSEAPGPLA